MIKRLIIFSCIALLAANTCYPMATQPSARKNNIVITPSTNPLKVTAETESPVKRKFTCLETYSPTTKTRTLYTKSPSNSPRPAEQKSFLCNFSRFCLGEYKEYSQKVADSGLTSSILPLEEFNKELDTFIARHATQTANFLNKKLWIDEKAPTSSSILDKAADLNFRHPYIEKIDLPTKKHILTFGDIHGSLHSLLRSLWRKVAEGFLTEDLVLTDPSNIGIFLGDLVDRGHYGVEVMYLALCLSNRNEGNFHIIRGNHEDPKMGVHGGLYTIRQELREKYASQSTLIDETLTKLSILYDLLPFGIQVGCNKHYKLFTHASIDPSYDITPLLIDQHAQYECLKDKQENSEFLDRDTRNKAIEYFNHVESLPYGDKNNFYCCGFNWGDIGCYTNGKGEIIHDDTKLVFSGHGYNMSLTVFDKYAQTVNKKLAPYGITFDGIVRGHQHMGNSLSLFDPSKTAQQGQLCDWKQLVSLHDIQAPEGFSMKQCYPIFTLTDAPEGVGNDNSHGIQVNCDKDACCVITTGQTPQEWFIKPYEYTITTRKPDGAYCWLNNASSEDPIQAQFTDNQIEHKDMLMLTRKTYSPRDEREDEVEAIFSLFKKQIDTEKIKSIDVCLSSDPLKYPIDFSIKTQSLNHIRHITNQEHITEQNIGISQNQDTKQLIENAIAQEIKYANDYYVFYHAHEGSLACFHDILNLFYTWGLLQRNQPLPLRFICADKYPASLDAFLEQTKTIVKNSTQEYEYYDEANHQQTTSWFDHIPAIGEQLLAVNYAIEGNHANCGESSLSYFNNNHSEHMLGTEVITKLCNYLQLPDYFLEKIKVAMQRYIDSAPNTGKLLQIFVKKDVVDEVAYWTVAGGKPVDQELLSSCWNPQKQRHTKISDLLNLYINEPEALNKQLSTYIYTGQHNQYNLNLDNIQARLWLPSPHLYNPEKTIIFRYGTSTTDHDLFIREINAIIAEIIRYIIHQKVYGKTDLFVHSHSPLATLDEIISSYMQKKNSAQANRVIDYYNLDTTHAVESPENKFIRLAPCAKNGTNKLSSLQLQELIMLCPRLSSGATPLMYAAQTNNLQLAKLLMNFPSTIKHLHYCDNNSKNIFTWLQIMQHAQLTNTVAQSVTPSLIKSMKNEHITWLINQMPDNIGFIQSAIEKFITAGDCINASLYLKHIIEKSSDPEIIQWAMDIVKELISKGDMYNAYTMAKPIIEKSSDPSTIQWAMNIAKELLSMGKTGLACEMAITIMQKNSDPTTIQWAMDIVKELISKGDMYNAYNMAKPIIEKSSDPSTIQWAMNIAKELLSMGKTGLACEMAMTIMQKNSDPETTRWAMEVVEKFLAKEELDKAHDIAYLIINKNSDPEIIRWGMKVAETVLANGGVDASLACRIIEKSSDPTTIKLGSKVLNALISKGMTRLACDTANRIIQKSLDPEIIRCAMEIVEKIITKDDAYAVYNMATTIIRKTPNPTTIKWAMEIVEKFLSAGELEYACHTACQIVDKSSGPETIQWAMNITKKILSNGNMNYACAMANMILEKSSDPEIIQFGMKNCRKLASIFHLDK